MLSPLTANPVDAARSFLREAVGPGHAAEVSAREFEAIFLQEILSTTLQPMLHQTPESASFTGRFYTDLSSQILAHTMAEGQGVGMARMLLPYLQPPVHSAEHQP